MAAAGSLILLLPLFGALLLALAGRFLPRRMVETAACAAILGSLAAAVILATNHWGETARIMLFQWFSTGEFHAAVSLAIDPLSMIMALMVTFVSFIIHVYSVWYMRHDEGYARYFCYLNLFVFFMLVIVLADDLIFLFLGWEGVGFCSYALIGFWYQEEERALAGRKAFILTRIGDVAFLVALALFFVHFGSVSLTFINSHASLIGGGLATILGLLLLWAATGKSAQLPLLVWLPDAMAGPTPVSALIHAATMVTAGVYLLMRLFPVLVLSPIAMTAVAVVGGVTAFIASCSALAQRDIKRVLAWSTISQVGYMFLGIGSGDVAGGMFHLLAHAFFKALLFMAAGCVIQALHEEQDIFKMGRKIRKAKPELFWLFFIGALALAAIPPVSGFFSKERILMADYGHAGWIYTGLWVLGTIAAVLTAIYTFRMIFLVFFGDPTAGTGREPIKIPSGMTRILWPLAILSVLGGLLNFPGEWSLSNWLTTALATVPGVVKHIEGVSETLIGTIDTIAALAGFFLAYSLYAPSRRAKRGEAFEERIGFWNFMTEGFGLDRLYRTFIAGPYAAAAGILWRKADEGGIDALALGLGKSFERASREVRLWNTGRLSTYLSMLLAGLFVILIILAGSVR